MAAHMKRQLKIGDRLITSTANSQHRTTTMTISYRDASTKLSSRKDTRFQFCKLPREVQLAIFAKLYCVRPWQLAVQRDRENKSTSLVMTEPVGPIHILHLQQFRELFEATMAISQNGSLLFTHGCIWDIQTDLHGIEGLQAFTSSITTIVFDQRLGDSQHLRQLRKACPKLRKVELNIGADATLERLVRAASVEMLENYFLNNIYSSAWFRLDDLVLGNYDQDMCQMIQQCLVEFTNYKEYETAVSEIIGAGENLLDLRLNLTVGVPLEYSMEAGATISANAEFMAMDLVMGNGTVQMKGKWFVDTFNYRRESEFALREYNKEDGKWNVVSSWVKGKVDVIGKYMSRNALEKKIILLERTY